MAIPRKAGLPHQAARAIASHHRTHLFSDRKKLNQRRHYFQFNTVGGYLAAGFCNIGLILQFQRKISRRQHHAFLGAQLKRLAGNRESVDLGNVLKTPGKFRKVQ